MGEATGDLYRVKGIMKKEDYLNILARHAVPSGVRLDGRGFTFQADNDPKHTSKLCKDYLQRKVEDGTLVLLDWPSQSPDLNPIELVWEEMDRRIRKEKPSSEAKLLEIVHDVWDNLNAEVLNKLVERMPRLCQAVIKAEGGYFDEKYAPRLFKHQPVYH